MDKGNHKNPGCGGGYIVVNKIRNRIFIVILLISLPIIINISGQTVTDYYKKPKKVIFIPKATDPGNDFWQTAKMGVELAAKEEGIDIEFVGAKAEKDIEEQIRVLENYIGDKDSIVLLAAAHAEKLVEVVRKIKENGITLVTVDSTVAGISDIESVATDNIEAAGTLTRYLANLMDRQGEVVMLNFIQGASTARDRQQGYEEEIKRYPNIMMHTTMYTEGTAESAYRGTLKIIEKYPNIKGIIAGNQQTTEGVSMAIEEKGVKDQIKVVGFDSSEIIVYGIEQSIIDAVVVQKPFNMGYLGVKNAMELYKGKQISMFTDTGYQLINKDSIYAVENQKLIYPIIK